MYNRDLRFQRNRYDIKSEFKINVFFINICFGGVFQ